MRKVERVKKEYISEKEVARFCDLCNKTVEFEFEKRGGKYTTYTLKKESVTDYITEIGYHTITADICETCYNNIIEKAVNELEERIY